MYSQFEKLLEHVCRGNHGLESWLGISHYESSSQTCKEWQLVLQLLLNILQLEYSFQTLLLKFKNVKRIA